MRRVLLSGLLGGALLASTAGMAGAQDSQRIEVPEAGIAVSFPADWDVEIVLEHELLDEDDPESAGHWDVLWADAPDGGWCSIGRLVDGAGTAEGFAAYRVDQLLEDAAEGETADWWSVDLAVGEAWRVDNDDPGDGYYSSYYVFDTDHGRYSQHCSASTRDPRDWMGMAETLELLPVEDIVDRPGEEPGPDAEPVVADQRIEVPEFGIAASFPGDWDVEIELESGLLDEDDPDSGYWRISTARDSATGSWCDLTQYLGPPGDADHVASFMSTSYEQEAEPGMVTNLEETALAVGTAFRLDRDDTEEGDFMSSYFFDSGETLFDFTCYSSTPDDRRWLDLAETLEWLPAEQREPGPDPDPKPAAAEQRIAVPEAGIAVTFPAVWDVEIRLAYELLDEDDPDSAGSWDVLRADDPDTGRCSIVRLVNPAGTAEHFVAYVVDRWQEDAADGETADARPVDLAVGEVWRADHDEPGDEYYSSLYVFDTAHGRYELACGADERDPRDWMDIAETLELLPVEGIIDAPGATDPVEPTDTADGDQRIEVPEAGLALTFPHVWDVEVQMEYDDRGDDDPETGSWRVFLATAEDDSWCDLLRFPYWSEPLDELATRLVDSLAEDPDIESVELRQLDVDIGEAYRLDSVEDIGYLSTYVFDSDSGRHVMTCSADVPEPGHWMDIAETLEWLPAEGIIDVPGSEPDPDSEPVLEDQRIEVSEAGIAVSFPTDWTIEQQMTREEFPMAGSVSDEPADLWRLFKAIAPNGDICGVLWYPNNPLSLDEHVYLVRNRLEATGNWSIELFDTGIPVGPAVRFDMEHTDGEVYIGAYFFESGSDRYYVQCLSDVRPEDDFLSIVGTVELLADPVGQWEAGPLGTTVDVSEAEVMRAWCERALWIEYPDGTYEERIECELSDEPVDPSQEQGTPPTETLTTSGGSCEWVSDYWLAEDGSELWAESWSVTVEPDGTVTGSSRYGAELLECSDE